MRSLSEGIQEIVAVPTLTTRGSSISHSGPFKKCKAARNIAGCDVNTILENRRNFFVRYFEAFLARVYFQNHRFCYLFFFFPPIYFYPFPYVLHEAPCSVCSARIQRKPLVTAPESPCEFVLFCVDPLSPATATAATAQEKKNTHTHKEKPK